eukprot:1178006-Prorocentrum_minimum.AAC.2
MSDDDSAFSSGLKLTMSLTSMKQCWISPAGCEASEEGLDDRRRPSLMLRGREPADASDPVSTGSSALSPPPDKRDRPGDPVSPASSALTAAAAVCPGADMRDRRCAGGRGDFEEVFWLMRASPSELARGGGYVFSGSPREPACMPWGE